MSKKAAITSTIKISDGPTYSISENLDLDTYMVVDEIIKDKETVTKTIDKIEDVTFTYMASDKKGVGVTMESGDKKIKIELTLDKPIVFIGDSLKNIFNTTGAVTIDLLYNVSSGSAADAAAHVQLFIGQYSA
jgi:hypothetical protein